MNLNTTALGFITIALAGALIHFSNKQKTHPKPLAHERAVVASQPVTTQPVFDTDSHRLVDDSIAAKVSEPVIPQPNLYPLFKDEAELLEIVPVWMLEGDHQYRFENAQVMGEEIARIRVRYRWDDGSSMEYEFTDIGATPKPHLLRGLGFNFDQQNTKSETGYTTT